MCLNVGSWANVAYISYFELQFREHIGAYYIHNLPGVVTVQFGSLRSCYLPLDDMTSFSLFNTVNEITTKFVILVILAPSPDSLMCSFSCGSLISMIF